MSNVKQIKQLRERIQQLTSEVQELVDKNAELEQLIYITAINCDDDVGICHSENISSCDLGLGL
jgi:hypothetical protein